LGLQLRSVQIKGIILLVTLFFTMLSLYIYLSIDQRLQDAALDFLNDRKRLGEAVSEKMIIDQEKTVAGATSVVNSLWICLTVIVWLLVPLFKPVKDADIDTKQSIRRIRWLIGGRRAHSRPGLPRTQRRLPCRERSRAAGNEVGRHRPGAGIWLIFLYECGRHLT
jgi:hypothetical protein